MRRRLFGLLCLLAAFIGVLSGQSNPIGQSDQANAIVEARSSPTKPVAQARSISFAKPVVYSSGGWAASSLATADLNRDGYLDIVVANRCPSAGNCANGEVSVLLGNSDGTFQPAVSYNSGGAGGGFVALSDLNGDGKLDLVITTACPNYSCVSVLLGNGDGTFQAAVTYYSGGYEPTSAAIGDVNGDGIPDLVASNACSVAGQNCQNGLVDGTIGVLVGNGDGTFQAVVSYDAGAYDANAVALGDLTGDGSLDVVVGALCPAAEFFNSCVAVLLNSGDGTFQPPATFLAFGQVTSLRIADLNGDGVADVAMSNSDGGVGVLLGNGNGTFQNVALYGSGGFGGSYSIAIGDVNGDGIPDLIAGNLCRTFTRAATCAGASNVGVLVGNGNGTFQDAISYNSGGSTPTSIAIGDVNGDGKPDLIVANDCSSTCETGTIGVLLNKTARAPTTTTLTSSPNPSQVNQAVTFIATITSSRTIPDGQAVQFYDGTALIGSGTTEKGVATLLTSFSKAKTYAIKAKYAGGGFLGASSGTVKQTVVNPE